MMCRGVVRLHDDASSSNPAVGGCLVIAGVSGSGKSTVALALAHRLGYSMLDADQLHDRGSIAKMSAGIPLTDEERWPWLQRVADVAAGDPGGLVIACSALRRKYRDFLAARVPGLMFCLLDVSPQVAADRLLVRTSHFMSRSLLASQFETLEALSHHERGFSVAADQDLAAVVTDALHGMRRLLAGGKPNASGARIVLATRDPA